MNKPFLLSLSGKDYLWGGNRINEDFGKDINLFPLAESWECSVYEDKAITIYKSRDENEKLFSDDKSCTGDKSLRVTTDERMSSKIFTEFIAIIIRCRFYTYIWDKFKDEGSRLNWSTVPTALRELEKIEMTRCYNGIYKLDHAMTKKQKEILSAFSIGGDDVKVDSKEICRVLASNNI